MTASADSRTRRKPCWTNIYGLQVPGGESISGSVSNDVRPAGRSQLRGIVPTRRTAVGVCLVALWFHVMYCHSTTVRVVFRDGTRERAQSLTFCARGEGSVAAVLSPLRNNTATSKNRIPLLTLLALQYCNNCYIATSAWSDVFFFGLPALTRRPCRLGL